MKKEDSSYSAKFWQPNIKENITLYKAHLNNYGFDKHVHEEYTISIIKDGVMDAFMNGSRLHVNDLTIAMVNPDEVHSNASEFKKDYQHCSLYLKPEYLKKVLNDGFKNKQIEFDKSILEDKVLAQKLLDLIKQDENKLISSIDFECKLVEAINELILKNTKAIKKTLTPHDTIIKKAKEYMNDNFSIDLGLDDIANELDVSKYHFLRLFKEKTFLSPHAYLMTRRIEKAKYALQNGKTLIDTAHGCGFNDQSHLNRRFKGIFGVTPKEYQNFFK